MTYNLTDVHFFYQIDGVTHKKYTRKWILERTHRYVQIIHSFGLQEGDVVGLCSENTIDMACIVYATLYLGLTLNPLNFLYTRAELRHMLSLTRPSIMFCSPAVEQLIVKTLSEDFPASARPLVIVIGDEKKFATNSTEELFKTTAKQSMEKIPICKVNPEENIAGIFSSSGTTGAAKGVSIAQAAFNFNLQVVKWVIRGFVELFNEYDLISSFLIFPGKSSILCLSVRSKC